MIAFPRNPRTLDPTGCISVLAKMAYYDGTHDIMIAVIEVVMVAVDYNDKLDSWPAHPADSNPEITVDAHQ